MFALSLSCFPPFGVPFQWIDAFPGSLWEGITVRAAGRSVAPAFNGYHHRQAVMPISKRL
jgi:hypothetical protein